MLYATVDVFISASRYPSFFAIHCLGSQGIPERAIVSLLVYAPFAPSPRLSLSFPPTSFIPPILTTLSLQSTTPLGICLLQPKLASATYIQINNSIVLDHSHFQLRGTPDTMDELMDSIDADSPYYTEAEIPRSTGFHGFGGQVPRPRGEGFHRFDDQVLGPRGEGFHRFDDQVLGPRGEGLHRFDDQVLGPRGEGFHRFDDQVLGPRGEGFHRFDDQVLGPRGEGSHSYRPAVGDYSEYEGNDGWVFDGSNPDSAQFNLLTGAGTEPNHNNSRPQWGHEPNSSFGFAAGSGK